MVGRSREERLFIQNNFAAQGAMRNLQDVQNCLLQHFKLFVSHRVLFDAAVEEELVPPPSPERLSSVHALAEGREAALLLASTTFVDRSHQNEDRVVSSSSSSTAHPTQYPPLPVLPLPRFMSLVDRIAFLVGKERRCQSAPADAVRSSLADLRRSEGGGTAINTTTTAAPEGGGVLTPPPPPPLTATSHPPHSSLLLSAHSTAAAFRLQSERNDVDQFLNQFGLSVRGSANMDGIDTVEMLAEMVAYEDDEDGGGAGGGDPFGTAAFAHRAATGPKKLERTGSRRLLQLALAARLSTTPLTSARRHTARGTAIALASHILGSNAAAAPVAPVGPPSCWTQPTFDKKGKGLHHDIFAHDTAPTEAETEAHLARLRTLQPRRVHSSNGPRVFPRTVAERLRLPPLSDRERESLPPPVRQPRSPSKQSSSTSSPALPPPSSSCSDYKQKQRRKSPPPIDFDQFVQRTYLQARENGISTTHMDLVVRRRNAQLRKSERDKKIEARKEELRKGFSL